MARVSEKNTARGAVIYAAFILAFTLPLGLLFAKIGFVPTGDAALPTFVTLYFLVAQDMWIGLVLAASVLGAWALSGKQTFPRRLSAAWAVPALAALAALLTIAFRFLVFHNYDLSLDEFIPAFQAEIFREGKLLAPLPEDMFALHKTFQPFFTYANDAHLFWGSGYRPVHAMLLALLPAGYSTALIHGALAGVAVWSIGDIAGRLFPGRTGAPALAALLLITSPQFLITAASGFSFGAHLAFNLVWLALFLRGSWRAHLLAAVLGFFAVGLHQVHVHLMFVLPFGVAMLAGAFGNRLKALPYLISYTLALALWMAWPEIAVWLQTGDASVLPRSLLEVEYIADYLRQSGNISEGRRAYGLALLIGNLWRFFLWLSPAILVLLALSRMAPRRIGLVPALCAAGLILTIVALHILMPNQTQTWGARYYHPVYGNAVLLGMAGLYALAETARQDYERLQRSVLLLCLAGALIFVPWRALQVEAKIGPRARVQAAIEAMDVDAVFIKAGQAEWFFADFIRNDPFLRNRPLIAAAVGAPLLPPGAESFVVLDKPALNALGLPSGTYLEP